MDGTSAHSADRALGARPAEPHGPPHSGCQGPAVRLRSSVSTPAGCLQAGMSRPAVTATTPVSSCPTPPQLPARFAGPVPVRLCWPSPARTLFSDFLPLPPPQSSCPARSSLPRSPTSAPRSAQTGVGPHPLGRRPLSGCRLSRKTIQAALPLRWPWSLSLPAFQRLGPAFAGLPVLCDHPTPLVPSSSRPFVLDEYLCFHTRRPRGLPG
jgi:hypothetical protein